jgi:ribosomal protein L35
MVTERSRSHFNTNKPNASVRVLRPKGAVYREPLEVESITLLLDTILRASESLEVTTLTMS